MDLDGLQVMVQSLTSPTDGPIGDSSLWVSDGTTTLLNQNDARPSDLGVFDQLGHVDLHLLQFSGAIWFPMVYELPQRAKQALGQQKRERQFDRTLRYIDDLKADYVFPIAGPPCFLDEELWAFNDIFEDPANIFPDQMVFERWMREQGRDNTRVLLPGSVADASADGCPVTHPMSDAEVDAIFNDKTAYLREMQARRQPEVEAEKLTWAHPEIDLLAELQAWFTPLLEEADLMSEGINGGIRLTAHDEERGDVDFVIDFVARNVRAYDGEKVRYAFTHPAGVSGTARPRARDRLGQQPVPVLPLLRAPDRAVQRVHLHVLQVPERGTAAVRRGLVPRARLRPRGHRDGRVEVPAPLRPPQSGSDPVRRGRGRRPDLPDARLEVAAGRRQVPDQRRQGHPQRAGPDDLTGPALLVTHAHRGLGDATRTSPGRDRFGHQVPEQLVRVGGDAVTGEPAADVDAVALQELRSARVGGHVDDLGQVDEHEPAVVDEQVVGRQVAVGPAPGPASTWPRRHWSNRSSASARDGRHWANRGAARPSGSPMNSSSSSVPSSWTGYGTATSKRPQL